MDSVNALTLSSENKIEFVDKLIQGLVEFFETDVDSLPDNYGYKHPWSLLSLIKDDKLDTYTLVYVNDRVWGGSGGMVRYIDNKKIYQGGLRWFSNAKNHTKGLGFIRGYTLLYTMPQQFDRAKDLQCDEYILSFNEYNKKFFEVGHKYHLKKAFPNLVFTPSNGMVMFNGVMQYTLTLDLKNV